MHQGRQNQPTPSEATLGYFFFVLLRKMRNGRQLDTADKRSTNPTPSLSMFSASPNRQIYLTMAAANSKSLLRVYEKAEGIFQRLASLLVSSPRVPARLCHTVPSAVRYRHRSPMRDLRIYFLFFFSSRVPVSSLQHGITRTLHVPYRTVYVTHSWSGVPSSIPRQPRGCQCRLIRLGKLSARCF